MSTYGEYTRNLETGTCTVCGKAPQVRTGHSWDTFCHPCAAELARRSVANAEEHVAAARRELARLTGEPECQHGPLLPDVPDFDGTDAAHPAWWRGQSDGVDGVVRLMKEALNGYSGGTLREPLHAVRETVRENARVVRRARVVWAAYKAYLTQKYPASVGQPWSFVCPHHRALDRDLG